MPTNRKKLKAYHEAGHAVIARVLGVGVPQLTLVSVDADTAASATTASAAALADRNDLFAHVAGIEKDIKISMAGPQSQNRYRPRTSTKIMTNGRATSKRK
jgi:ATP-dependent Zn protease